MDNEYYILENGQKLGPFTPDELMNRPLEPTDLLIQPLQNQGIPAHDLPEFEDYFKSEGIYYPTQKNTGGYLLRLPAFIIDYFVIVIAVMILAFILVPGYVTQFEQIYSPKTFTYQSYVDNAMKHQNEAIIMQIALFVLTIFYNSFFESTRLQGSVGKYAVGLAVVDELGYAVTFWQALKRNLGKLIYEILSFIIGPLCYVAYLRMIWGERHQAMHDQFSRCYVVSKNR